MAQSISQLVASVKAGGTFGIPACNMGSLEINPLGFPCYSNVEVIHRVSDPACALPSLGEEGELGGPSCSERWIMDLASAWPDLDCTSMWFCGITGHETNPAGVAECQAPGCGILRESLHEVGAALWAISLQECEDLKLFEIQALVPENPAAEVITLLSSACGRAKVGTCNDGPEAFACSLCFASDGNLEVSDIDTTHDAVDTVETPFPLANNNQVDTPASLAAKRRSLRGNGSDQLWPFTTGSIRTTTTMT